MKVKLLSFDEAVVACKKHNISNHLDRPCAFGIFDMWEYWGEVVDVPEGEKPFVGRMIAFDGYGIPSWLYAVVEDESNG